MVATHGQKHIPHAFPIHLSTEAGMFGGFPTGGNRCGPTIFEAWLLPRLSYEPPQRNCCTSVLAIDVLETTFTAP